MNWIKLIPVEEVNALNPDSATRFLYQLLAERDPIANISHREIPTFEQHKTFVETHPYEAWYIVFCKDVPIGHVCITKPARPSVAGDEIGVAIIKDAQGHGYGKQAVRLVMEKHPRDRYLANIAPGNLRSVAMFGELGFKSIQLTMEKTNE